MMTRIHLLAVLLMVLTIVHASGGQNGCKDLPSHSTLQQKLREAVAAEQAGFNFNFWATLVDRDGIVCAVAFSGTSRSSQWAASRLISGNKASIANGLSLDFTSFTNSGPASSGRSEGFVLSTANLYAAVQPGGSLYGLCEANPTNNAAAYKGNPGAFGTVLDPLVGERIGGCITFGGGLALYTTTQSGQRAAVGGIGVSGDTACADHRVAWRVRNLLGLDKLVGVAGVNDNPALPDNIIYPAAGGAPSGFEHPRCAGEPDIPGNLPPVTA